MIKKYYINMTQKGKFEFMCKRFIELNYITFTKTDKKQVQIVTIDFDKIDQYYQEEVEASNSKAFLTHYKNGIFSILGINNNNPYKLINECKEIKTTNKTGYIEIDFAAVEKETEKAYLISNNWIAKSQTVKEDNKLYIKDWLFFKSFN